MTKRRGGVVRVSARTTVVALMLGATVVACLPGTARSPAFTAETVGIVSTRQLDGVDLRYTFTDGRSIVVPHTTRKIGSQPDAGHLFLGGSQPEPWFKGIPPKPVSPGDPIPAGCYQLDGPAWANGTTVFVHVGDASGDAELALPKSQDWVDPTFLNGTDQLSGLRTCVNAKGEATLRF